MVSLDNANSECSVLKLELRSGHSHEKQLQGSSSASCMSCSHWHAQERSFPTSTALSLVMVPRTVDDTGVALNRTSCMMVYN